MMRIGQKLPRSLLAILAQNFTYALISAQRPQLVFADLGTAEELFTRISEYFSISEVNSAEIVICSDYRFVRIYPYQVSDTLRLATSCHMITSKFNGHVVYASNMLANDVYCCTCVCG